MVNEFYETEDGIVILVKKKSEIYKCLVSKEDFNKVKSIKTKWYFDKYAYTNVRKKKVYLHRLIMNPSEKEVVDHINGDKLDNRRSNLRNTNQSVNSQNQRKLNKKNTSGYRNVWYDKRLDLWEVRVCVDNKSKFIGRYKSKEEANKEAVKARGELHFAGGRCEL